jgi:hypothetical protein
VGSPLYFRLVLHFGTLVVVQRSARKKSMGPSSGPDNDQPMPIKSSRGPVILLLSWGYLAYLHKPCLRLWCTSHTYTTVYEESGPTCRDVENEVRYRTCGRKVNDDQAQSRGVVKRKMALSQVGREVGERPSARAISA